MHTCDIARLTPKPCPGFLTLHIPLPPSRPPRPRLRVKIEAIYRDEKEVAATRSGENLRLRVTGAEDTDISAGFVLSSIKNPVPIVTTFEAQLMIVELLEHNPIFTVRA